LNTSIDGGENLILRIMGESAKAQVVLTNLEMEGKELLAATDYGFILIQKIKGILVKRGLKILKSNISSNFPLKNFQEISD